MVGDTPSPQNDETVFRPTRSPYACAEVYGYGMVKNYSN
jgi:GDP-D-mannose dehydratase